MDFGSDADIVATGRPWGQSGNGMEEHGNYAIGAKIIQDSAGDGKGSPITSVVLSVQIGLRHTLGTVDELMLSWLRLSPDLCSLGRLTDPSQMRWIR